MMQFTLGATLLAFSLIMGGYMYMENADLINIKQRGLTQVEQKFKQNAQMIQRLSTIKEKTMERGQDQKANLERFLGIGAPGLVLSFTGTPLQADGSSNNFYRHNFRVIGPATFMKAQEVITKMAETPGFTVHKVCLGCTRRPSDLPEGQNMVSIEGFLYVYNPEAFR